MLVSASFCQAQPHGPKRHHVAEFQPEATQQQTTPKWKTTGSQVTCHNKRTVTVHGLRLDSNDVAAQWPRSVESNLKGASRALVAKPPWAASLVETHKLEM